MLSKYLFTLLFTLFFSLGNSPLTAQADILFADKLEGQTKCKEDLSNTLEPFVGSFGSGDYWNDDVVTFKQRRGTLLMHPALWSGPMVLERVSADSFFVTTHPRFAVKFLQDSQECVSSARIYGLSQNNFYERIQKDSPRPIQLLLAGHPKEAARKYVQSDQVSVQQLLMIGQRLMRSLPTKIEDTEVFFTELSQFLPNESEVWATLGEAYVFTDKREKAKQAFKKALELDSSNETAITSLQMLGELPVSNEEGWELPFALDKLFIPPKQEEIDAVWTEWQERDLDPKEVEVVLKKEINFYGNTAEARIIAHRVHGKRHLGVVIVPAGLSCNKAPVLIEAKGVSPSFFPLEIPDGLTSPHVLQEARSDVIYFAPGYRGEQIVIGSDTLTSEGDRSDAWDGATDDTISFLRAALQVTPEADTTRICMFGRSRGGTVALLTGIRERQVDCVVSWAAPTDWFSRMDLNGWKQKELVGEGLRNRAVPGETGGQFINYFLSPAIEGEKDLRETRLHLIAGSPLYFAEKLPLAQVHWGMEDTSVPIVNGRDIVNKYRQDRNKKCLDVHFYPDAGHDQDRQLAPVNSKEFLLKAFGLPEKDIAECRNSNP